MLFNSSQLSLNIILLVLLGIYNQVDITMAVSQCYVCGFKDHPDCDMFDPNNQSFIKTCDQAYCQIVIDGSRWEKNCSDVTVEDCKNANDVTYCYCKGNLCNHKHKASTKFSDDEDLAEGSGTTTVTTNTNQKEQKTSNITNQSNHLHFYLYSTYISVLAILCN